MSPFTIEAKPLKLITGVFIIWKAIILIITLSAPGPGYDTSSTFLHLTNAPTSTPLSTTPTTVPSFLTKFVRWDAIYYTQVTHRGHLFEQEWAFGIGLSSTLRWLTKRIFLNSYPELCQIAVTGIVLSHAMHYLSTIIVFYIASLLLDKTKAKSAPSSIPTLSALLYILSPAGVILSAPYSEALFAFRNLLGLFIYLLARRSYLHSTLLAFGLTVLSGLILGTATAVRSNGILSGIPFFIDFITTLHTASLTSAQTQRPPPPSVLAKLSALVVGGLLIATGQILPQIRAYHQFCTSPIAHQQPLQPWCTHTIPSIFTYVQHHYWNVGLFNYWEVGNLPLFALALPAISLLTYSSIRAIRSALSPDVPFPSQSPSSNPPELQNFDKADTLVIALPQLVLAIAAVFSYHVQIITRLASGYPWWYIWLATCIAHQPTSSNYSSGAQKRSSGWLKGEHAVRWMVLYAMIQAGLYASFLPPA